jgi:hypothetical protein
MESIKIRCQTRHKKYQPSDKLLPWKRRPGARGSKHSFFLGKSTWTNWRAQPNRALYVLYFQTACAYVRGCWAPYVWDQAVSGMSTMSKPACTAVFGGESSCDVGKKIFLSGTPPVVRPLAGDGHGHRCRWFWQRLAVSERWPPPVRCFRVWRWRRHSKHPPSPTWSALKRMMTPDTAALAPPLHPRCMPVLSAVCCPNS